MEYFIIFVVSGRELWQHAIEICSQIRGLTLYYQPDPLISVPIQFSTTGPRCCWNWGFDASCGHDFTQRMSISWRNEPDLDALLPSHHTEELQPVCSESLRERDAAHPTGTGLPLPVGTVKAEKSWRRKNQFIVDQLVHFLDFLKTNKHEIIIIINVLK